LSSSSPPLLLLLPLRALHQPTQSHVGFEIYFANPSNPLELTATTQMSKRQ
jgi:hypothetical protein